MNNFVFCDVNLDQIEYLHQGRDIRLSFIDMEAGRPACEIVCKAVALFNYQNCFDIDDGLPCYVAEVVATTVPAANLTDFFGSKGMGRMLQNLAIDQRDEQPFYRLALESGELMMEIICRSIERAEVAKETAGQSERPK